MEACGQPDGYVDNDDDCNDASSATHPYGGKRGQAHNIDIWEKSRY